MASIYQRVLGRLEAIRTQASYPAKHFDAYRPLVTGKAGIEIGGPSAAFGLKNVLPLYDLVGSLDNCDFSSATVWADHQQQFVFSPNKQPGTSFFCEGSELTPIANQSYDFLLSSHNLEHFANPLKALHEWKRVLRPGGALIVILPYYCATFDHKRTPTPVPHMLQDFQCNTGEDDLTHLPEILEKHDLVRDPLAGSFEAFQQRSQQNILNRCLHHHVFDEVNSRGLLTEAGFNVLAVDIARPIHLCLLAQAGHPLLR